MLRTGNVAKKESIPKLALLSIVILVAGMILAFYGLSQANTISSLNSKLNSSQQNVIQYQKNTTILNNSIKTLKTEQSLIQGKYNSLLNQTQTPYIKDLATNTTIFVPASNFSVPFYNSEYNLYNNYTVGGDYFINFTAPYDGYLLVYLRSTTAKNGTYSFQLASNTSRTFFFEQPIVRTYRVCIFSPCQMTFDAESGYQEIPNTTEALYVLPVLRGQASFEIQNGNPNPIAVNLSIRYVGERAANISINTNYT